VVAGTTGRDAVPVVADAVPRTRRWSWTLVPIGIFLLTRVVDAVWLLLALRQQYPASQVPGDGVVPIERDPHTYSNVIQNFDGQWFRLVTEHGYPTTLATLHGSVIENQWPFYPLFPALVKLVMLTTDLSYGVSATLLNLVLGCAAMCVLYRMVASTSTPFAGAMSVVVIATFPSAVVFQAAYSEALSFLLVVTSVWLLHQRRYGWVAVSGVLLALTRPIVLPFALIVALHWLLRWRTRARDPFPTRDRYQVAALACGLGLSFGIWPITAWIVTGQRNAYLSSVGAWSWGQSGYSSWLTRVLTGDWVVVALLVAAVGAQTFFLMRSQARRLWAPELRTWSFSYAAYLLVATRPNSSMLRHVIMVVIPWWPFPEIGERVQSRREKVLLALLVGGLGLASQFIWVRWFWVPGPGYLSFP
jgi:hypothetical protein